MYLKIRVKAGARVEKIVKESDDMFVISVKENSRNNEANRRVIEIMKQMFPEKKVRIVHGHRKSSKLISVEEIKNR